ncbi:MAG TPA: PAS domain S-box protein [Alphaproteobacteria bacterium]|nr:PAS domain S-box protein [Alphaproteobacteria bacterium]
MRKMNVLDREPAVVLKDLPDELLQRLHALEQTVTELRASERCYRGLVESAQDIMVRIDPDLRITFANDACCRTFGRLREELIGTQIFPMIFPDDLPNTLAALRGLAKPPHRTGIVERLVTSQGIRWIAWEACAIVGHDGEVLEYQGVGRDVTEFRRLENELSRAKDELEQRVLERTSQLEEALAEHARIAHELEQQNRHIRAIENVIPVGIFECDTAGQFVYANAGLIELTGFTEDQLSGYGWRRILAEPGADEIYLDWQRAVQEHQPYLDEVRIGTPDGVYKWVLCQATPMFGPGGVFRGHLGTLTDITHQKAVQEALRAGESQLRLAKEFAERANLAKSKFLAAASHDLRQPLQAANLFLAVLQGRVGEEERRFVLGKLQQSLNALESLLNALLDVSKLEAGVNQPSPSVFPVGELLVQLASEFGPRAVERRLRFKLVAPSLYLHTDRTFVERILRNLLSNALAYTERGGILLGARSRGKNLRIEVWDTGIGIPGDRLEDIFEDFTQLGNDHRDRDRGLGLGLAIVKRIAKLLESQVTVRSIPGKGSVFACEFPLAQAPLPEQAVVATRSRPAQGGVGKLIAVIDDVASVREGLALLLSDWGHLPIVGASTDEVLQQLSWLGLTPDLVIADYQLAESRTGTEAIETIRRHSGRIIPAIVLTGDTAPEHLGAARSKGYVLLHKPIGQEHLRLVLGSLLEGKGAARI